MRKQVAITSIAVVLSIFVTSAFGATPVLEVSPLGLNFTAGEGGVNPASEVLSIWRGGGNGPLNWAVTEECDWLVVEPNSGTSMGEVDDVNVIVDISGLTGGTYNCQITVAADGAENSPQVVDVNLMVVGPILEISSTSFEFTTNECGFDLVEQILNISNTGGGTLNWEISEDCNWLTVEPNTGSSTGEVDDVNLGVDITGMSAGDYICELVVSDPNASNSPQVVEIFFHVYQSVVLIPSEFPPDIQFVIDFIACDGTTIILEPGTYAGSYNRDIDFGGKAITLRSTDPNDPNIVATTIIDCQGSDADPHRGFYFHNGEDGNSVINGLTIKNGFGHYETISGYEIPTGGGIYCYQSSPTIRNCIITGNTAHHIIDYYGSDFHIGGRGAGIYCYQSNPKINNCTISNNRAGIDSGVAFGVGGLGGGIYCEDSSPIISNCTITNNETEWLEYSEYWYPRGGGIYMAGGAVTISGCTIIENYSSGGGGIYCSGIATVEDCNISSNEATWSGGGLVTGGSTSVRNCEIKRNWVFAGGGGIYGSGSVANCVISQNAACGDPDIWGGIEAIGAGIYSTGSPTIINCTIADNNIERWGHTGGVYCSGNPNISNCIVWNNYGAEIAYGGPVVTYSNIQGGYFGEGNIDADPCFVDSVNDDYHLLPNSPCIEAGDPNYISEPNELDLAGHPRVVDGDCNDTDVVDIGAYEFDYRYLGDFDGECDIDFFDFAVLGDAWM